MAGFVIAGSATSSVGDRGVSNRGVRVIAGLVIAGLVIAGLVIAGLVIAGFVIAGLVIAGFVIAGLNVSLVIAGFVIAGFSRVGIQQQRPGVPVGQDTAARRGDFTNVNRHDGVRVGRRDPRTVRAALDSGASETSSDNSGSGNPGVANCRNDARVTPGNGSVIR